MIGRALRGGGEQRATLSNPVDWLLRSLGVQQSAAGVDVSVDGALAHADVFACVGVLARNAQRLPLKVYRKDGANDRVEVTDTPVAKRLAKPSPTLTRGGLVALTMAHMNAWGNAYWAKIRPSAVMPVERFEPIHPSRVRVHKRNGEPIFEVRKDANGDGAEGSFTRRDIVHFKGLSLDGLCGVSPIGQAREGIGLAIASEEAAAAFWANGGAPAGVIEATSKLTPEALTRLRAGWDAQHKGTGNAGKVAILESGYTWKAVGMPPEDAQWVETRKLGTLTVCRIFGVFPWMIGADGGGSMTYSNVESQMLAFAIHSLAPWLDVIEETLAADDDLFAEDEYPEFVMDALLRGDSVGRASVYSQALNKWMTVNEIRRRENLPAIDGGDEIKAPAPPPVIAPHAPAPPAPDPAADPAADPTKGKANG